MDDGYSFKVRRLFDDAIYEVIENYYNAVQLRHVFKPWAKDLELRVGIYFWRVRNWVVQVWIFLNGSSGNLSPGSA